MTALLTALLFFLPHAWGQDEPTPMSFDDFEFAAEEMESPAAEARRAKRSQTIDLLVEMSAQSQAVGDQRADIMLRLAHLMHQQGRETRDDALVERSAKLYALLLQEFPTHAKADHITFYLGFAMATLGQDAEAKSVLARVVKTYPSSEYVPHAFLHLGEVYFAEDDYLRAAKAYERAEGDSFPFADFAAYKHAWALHRGGNVEAALTRMGEAVGIARAGLTQTAIDTLAYWSKAAGVPVDPAMTRRMVTRSFGDCRDDLGGLRATLAEAPMAAEAFEAQLRICRCLHATGAPGLRGELRTLEARFGKGSPWWKQQPRVTRKRVRQALKDAKDWE